MTGDVVLVLVVAALFAAMGGYGLVAPAALVRPFGIVLAHPAARAEVRAVYGGFGIAVAVVLTVAGLNRGAAGAGAVTAVAAALLGMAAGRLAARVAESPGGFYPSWFYFWVELTTAGLLLAGVWI